MKNCKLKKYIYDDINNICFALSNPNKYDLRNNSCNTKIVLEHVKLLYDTMKCNIKYNVKINNCLVNLWTEAEKSYTISNKINTYGKNKYLAVILIYFSAKYNTIFISNHVDVGSALLLSKHSHYDNNCCHRDYHNHYNSCHKYHYHYHNDCYTTSMKASLNLIEHRTSKGSNNYATNSYNLSFNYELDQNECLKKTSWDVNYNFLQSTTIQKDFIDACKSSWVNNILLSL